MVGLTLLLCTCTLLPDWTLVVEEIGKLLKAGRLNGNYKFPHSSSYYDNIMQQGYKQIPIYEELREIGGVTQYGTS